MKKALCLVSLCALAAAASADIDLFLTMQGATNATTYVGTQTSVGSRFNQNVTRFTFASGATTTNPGTLSHGPFNLGAATPAAPVTATFYVWAHFTNIPVFTVYDPDTGEPIGTAPGYLQIWGLGMNRGYGLSPACRTRGAAAISHSATYRQINAPYYQRWDNTDPLPFPWSPATTGTTPGAGLAAPNAHDPLTRDFAGNGTDFYVLIGAFEYTATGTSQFFFGVGNPLLFIAVRLLANDGAIISDWDTRDAAHYYPNLTVMGQSYTYAAHTQPLVAITTTPEPTSLGLLALAGVLARRR